MGAAPNAIFAGHDAALRVEPSRLRSRIYERQRNHGTLSHRPKRRLKRPENSQLRPAAAARANCRDFWARPLTHDQPARTLASTLATIAPATPTVSRRYPFRRSSPACDA